MKKKLRKKEWNIVEKFYNVLKHSRNFLIWENITFGNIEKVYAIFKNILEHLVNFANIL